MGQISAFWGTWVLYSWCRRDDRHRWGCDRAEDGKRVKMKTDAYSNLHRLQGRFLSPSQTFKAVVMETSDDLKGKVAYDPLKDLWLELVLLFDLAYLEPWGLLMLQISTCISVQGGRQCIVQSKVPLCHVQLICNDRKMIRAAKIGWPGSCYDNTIWQRSKIFQNKHLFFRGLSFCLLDTPTPLCLASSTSNLKLQSLQTIYSTICSHKLVAKLNMSMVYWSTLDLQ